MYSEAEEAMKREIQRLRVAVRETEAERDTLKARVEEIEAAGRAAWQIMTGAPYWCEIAGYPRAAKAFADSAEKLRITLAKGGGK